MRETIPQFISRLFEPMIVFTALALGGGWQAGLTGSDFGGYALYLIGLVSLIGLTRIWMKRKYKLDWDISERGKRIRPLVFLLGFLILNWWFIRNWRSAELVSLYTIFCIWLIGFLFITLRFKISGHVGVATLAAGLVIYWFGVSWWPVAWIVPLIAWARVVGRKHTTAEVIVGAIYSTIILFSTI